MNDGVQNEQVNLDAETVIAIQRDKINGMQWQLTLLEARAVQAEKQVTELLAALSERSAPSGDAN